MYPGPENLGEGSKKRSDFEESRDKIEKAIEELAEAGRMLNRRIGSILIPEVPSLAEKEPIKEDPISKSDFRGFVDTTHQKIKAMTVYLNLIIGRVSL